MMKRDKQKEIETYVIIYHHRQGNSFTWLNTKVLH